VYSGSILQNDLTFPEKRNVGKFPALLEPFVLATENSGFQARSSFQRFVVGTGTLLEVGDLQAEQDRRGKTALMSAYLRPH
jgi:hypothetical protein